MSSLNLKVVQLIEHAQAKLVGWDLFAVGSKRRRVKRYLRPVQRVMGARKQFTHGAAIDSPPVQHPLRK